VPWPLKIHLGPAGSGEFRPPGSSQQNQPDRDTRPLRSLRHLIDVVEEAGKLLVIKGALARPFGASRTKEQLNWGTFRQSAGGFHTGTSVRAIRPRDWP
jgi:hypothetical protein